MRRAIPILLGAAALVAVAAAPSGATAGKAAKPKIVKVIDVPPSYGPPKVNVKKDGKVKWVWPIVPGDVHTVSLKSGPSGVKKFSSHPPAADNFTYVHKFTKAGTYNIYCKIHPTIMKMKVVVGN